MAIIKNSDYSVGTVKKLNQYEMDNTEAQQQRLQQLFFNESNKTEVKKRNWNKISNKNGAAANTPEAFNSKLQVFFFGPPSDNLWNIEFFLSTHDENGNNNEKTDLLQLYNNILSVNQKWKSSHSEAWEVNTKLAKNKSQKTPNDFLSHLSNNQIGLFLAQRVFFNPFGINYDGNTFGEFSQLGGFYKNSKIVRSRRDDDSLKINFLISNWDITEILIDPWIAAIAQQGLIADSSKQTIKAKIILTEYSASHEKFASSEVYSGIMEARKQYIFDNCFPISRETPEKTYEPDEAGKFKTSIVTFSYDSYKINYLF